MEIVEAHLPELDLLVPLFDRYRQFYKRPSDPESCRRFLRERIENGESVIYLALSAGLAEGFVQLYPSFSSVAMKRLWILNDLFVSAAARRSGTGRALLERARQLAIDTSAKGLALSTGIDNVTAQRLYEQTGYRRDAEFFQYVLCT
ncbi:MAG: GNAT family N-acetyltransferase [Bryobacteraceae bacterium]